MCSALYLIDGSNESFFRIVPTGSAAETFSFSLLFVFSSFEFREVYVIERIIYDVK